MAKFMKDSDVVDRVLGHVKNKTTDRGETVWREPVDHYTSSERLARELAAFKSLPTPFSPSVALEKPGDYIARVTAGTPLIVTRGQDGKARAFKNACRHRGSELVSGSGCVGAFVCPYHGWSYGLEGELRGIPHADGFPDVDKREMGLFEMQTIEKHGLVYVVQDGGKNQEKRLADLPEFIKPGQILFDVSEGIIEANWKLHMESFLEGYHIKPAHKETFFPFGYDNLNVIEFCGSHARVTFPFQRIETLADVAPQDRRVSDKLTYLNHLFPNVVLAELSHHMSLGILEPLDEGRTRFTSYHLTKPTDNPDKDAVIETARRDLEFVNGTGQQEDIALVEGIQRSLHSGANQEFVFGHFEPAIVHFHQQLEKVLAEA